MVAIRNLLLVASTAFVSTGVNAQFSGLSSTCTVSAATLLIGDLSTCLNLNSLIPIFTGSGSIVAPLDSYLNSICSSSACSTDTINNANSTIQNNCQSDLQSGNTLITALATVLREYPVVREIGCLQAAGNGTRCIVQTLYGVQNATGTDVSTSFVTGLLGGSSDSLSGVSGLNSSTLCTDCTRAMYLVAEGGLSNGTSVSSGAVGTVINRECGAGFTNTSSFPADVSNTIGSATASASASAAASSSAAATSSGAALKDIKVASFGGAGLVGIVMASMGVVAGGMAVLA